MTSRLVAILVLALALFGGLFAFGKYRYNSGAAKVQAEWNVDKANHEKEVKRLTEIVRTNEGVHKAEVAAIESKLTTQKANHEQALASIVAVSAQRLLDSQTRGAIYKRQAEGGAAECTRLASHAAELDRTLEEGRYLVRELRETLGFRDDQIIELANQIRADRKLLNDEKN